MTVKDWLEGPLPGTTSMILPGPVRRRSKTEAPGRHPASADTGRNTPPGRHGRPAGADQSERLNYQRDHGRPITTMLCRRPWPRGHIDSHRHSQADGDDGGRKFGRLLSQVRIPERLGDRKGCHAQDAAADAHHCAHAGQLGQEAAHRRDGAEDRALRGHGRGVRILVSASRRDSSARRRHQSSGLLRPHVHRAASQPTRSGSPARVARLAAWGPRHRTSAQVPSGWAHLTTDASTTPHWR
jgi:hypothetical protein